MKLSNVDKAVLFLAAGFFVLAYLSIKHGQTTLFGCWVIGAFGCCVMLYATHSGNKKKNKK